MAEEQRWAEVVRLLESRSSRNADETYYYGVALAHLGHLEEAHAALFAGTRTWPGDARFAVELGGVCFLQKRYAKAAGWLRHALRQSPRDNYATDLLGSTYFLLGNVEAALKYWNRIDKPSVVSVRTVPELRIRPALLDRTFAFSPASTLRLSELRTTAVRARGLEVFATHTIDLGVRPDNQFDVIFRAQERNGFGSSRWTALASTLRGIFYQSVYVDYWNARGSATNVNGLARWDPDKRRAFAELSGPIRNNPKWRYRLAFDGRNENWNLRDSSANPSLLTSQWNMRRQAARLEAVSFTTDRWQWSTGAELSHRDFRNVSGAVPAESLFSGYSLKHLARVNFEWLRVPERRVASNVAVSSQVGKTWSAAGGVFAKGEVSAKLRWFPRAQGDDFEMVQQIRAGATAGHVPFDELYMLGIDRDSDQWLRGHSSTENGRKGNAPLGTRYFLANWQMDKNLYSNGIIRFTAGPFLDTGTIAGLRGSASTKWLVDTGAQVKIGVLGVGVTFSYGKDLRTGRNVFYVTTAR